MTDAQKKFTVIKVGTLAFEGEDLTATGWSFRGQGTLKDAALSAVDHVRGVVSKTLETDITTNNCRITGDAISEPDMTDAPNPSAAKTGEPVAWRRKDCLREGHYFADRPETVRMWRERGLNPEPLYTHPQPSLSVGLDREAVIDAAVASCVRNTGKNKCWVREWMPRVVDTILALAAPAEGWQPIETLTDTQRDGRFVLAFVGNADGRWEHLNGRVFAVKHQGKTSSDFDLGWSLYPGLGGISDSWFTAWKPLDLPAAPTGETGA